MMIVESQVALCSSSVPLQEAEHPMLMVFRTSRVTNMALGMSLGFFVVDMAATLKYNVSQ